MFPVGTNGSYYQFHIPQDFGLGGVVFLDGEIKTYDFEDSNNDENYNFDPLLNEGNHVLEIYGVESCCDDETSWAFAVDNSEWLPFTAENLDMFKYEIIIEPEPTLC